MGHTMRMKLWQNGAAVGHGFEAYPNGIKLIHNTKEGRTMLSN